MTTVNVYMGRRIDELMARDIAIRWAEAVAVVQATCRQILITKASGFPAAAQIVLYEEGAVVALATTQQGPARAAAHLLSSLLGDDAPVRLRLLVWQAASADDAYATLDEFSKALDYFSRPDPADLLRELFRRAAATPAKRTKGHRRGIAAAAAALISRWRGSSPAVWER